MARKPALSKEYLTALGAEKLAELVLDEVQANAGFKRRVNAALAGKSGPEAIAKLIDRRLSGLERARAFIDWDKERAFRDDLQGLCDSIVKELCPADADLGASRLIRFVATHDQVFQRVDDSSGKLQDIYWQAIEAMGPVAARASSTDLPQVIMAALGETEHGYLKPVAERVVPHLSPEVLAVWDADLSERVAERDAEDASQRARERWLFSMTGQWREIRQMIAAASGDLDRLIAIEAEKPERDRDTLDIAGRLLDAGRPTEALDWVRRGGPKTHLRPFGIEDDDDDPPDHSPLFRQSELEARILRALDRTPEALSLLWDRFCDTLAPALLRAHLKMLPDFEDMEAEERAMTLALEHPDTMAALNFFLAWQRRDLAAQLVVARHAEWQGRDWHILPEVAEQLQHEHPLAASILFRTLLDDILGRARSKAYGHGAKYLRQLDLLAAGADADPTRPAGFDAHEAYRAKLRSDHGRKSGFWAQFGEPLSVPKSEPSWRGRRPLWTSDD